MALIECKGCGNKISQYAQACPKCGLSLTQNSEEAESPVHIDEPQSQVIETHEPLKHKKKSYAKWIVLLSSTAVIIVFVVLYLSGVFKRPAEITTDNEPSEINDTRTDYDNSTEAESDEPESEEYEEEYYEQEEEDELTAQDVEDNLSAWVDITYDYKQKLITGVHDIQIVVRNNSDFMLKSARIEVQYQRINNKVFDREYVQFNSVGPHSSMTLYAPNKSEGSFVKCVLLEGDVSNN